MAQSRLICFAAWVACPVLVGAASAAEVTVQRSAGGAVVKIDGQLFTEYLVSSGNKPILWPVIGPTGQPMTRSYPMKNVPGETKDHPHQRSIWFTHGDVNGIGFWDQSSKAGRIVHREFVKLAGGETAAIVTRNDWLAPDGKKQLEDQRALRFGLIGETRWIDFDITLIATEGPVRFGDTKEGTFGVRVAEALAVDAKRGGTIVNSQGERDTNAWGKRASWVDYFGSVDHEAVGIAILNHPSSFRYPTFWHVRTYGLYAANPFGTKNFTGRQGDDGSYTLPAGEKLPLRYRLLFHRGDWREAGIARRFADYAKEKK
jgi:hypothetical protein